MPLLGRAPILAFISVRKSDLEESFVSFSFVLLYPNTIKYHLQTIFLKKKRKNIFIFRFLHTFVAEYDSYP